MVLFLDFDGVLHPLNREQGTFTFSHRFEQVMLDYPAVDIVVSSAWRETHSVDMLRSLFSEFFRRRIVDVTPILDISSRYIRQKEITAWIYESGREYEAWIALDDSDWLFSPDCQNLILVDGAIGFNECAETQLRHALRDYKCS